MRLWAILLMGLSLVVSGQIALGATVHGNVYDLSLSVVEGVRVTVNSTPAQQMISTEDGYRFSLNKGTFLLEARLLEDGEDISKDNSTLVITEDGDYVNDLILFPTFEEEETDIPDVVGNLEEERMNPALLVLFLVMMLFGGLAYAMATKRGKESGSDPGSEEGPKEVVRILKQEGGRMTQKELRSKMPLSEAKVSLLVAELEQKGKIEKIKKGRGNIIVLKDR